MLSFLVSLLTTSIPFTETSTTMSSPPAESVDLPFFSGSLASDYSTALTSPKVAAPNPLELPKMADLVPPAPPSPKIPAPKQDPAVAHDVFPGDPFPKPWVDPGFKKLIWVNSPNYGRRPDNAIVDTVVIHSTVIPTLKDTAGAFYRESSKVSAHFVIGKDGSIVQCVSTFCRAWHAGKSRDFRGYDDLNNFSIGIELVNLDDGKDPYPKAQILALKALIRVLKRRFPLTQITSHEFIALPYGRKDDPAGFPWKEMDDLDLNVTHVGKAPLTSVPIPVAP